MTKTQNTTAPAIGTVVKPDMRGAHPQHWAHALRGTVLETTPFEALVKWDYEALGGESLAAYWIEFSSLVEVAA